MISYYFEDTDFIFKGKTRNNKWLKLVAESEIRRIGDISIIFCSDNYILDVNQQYLQHDYFTYIITFDYCEGGTEFSEELHRVIVHGVLHLIGYDDHNEKDIAMMRKKENYYLSLRELV